MKTASIIPKPVIPKPVIPKPVIPKPAISKPAISKPVILAFTLAIAPIFATAAACDSPGGGNPVGPQPGVVTLGPEQGVDFSTGEHQDKGNFQVSDLYATDNGDRLKLSPGGESPTRNRVVNWFLGAGGLYETFGSLADVPDAPKPDDSMTFPLPHAKTGNGFILLNRAGGWTKGWINIATATSLTIEYEPLN